MKSCKCQGCKNTPNSEDLEKAIKNKKPQTIAPLLQPKPNPTPIKEENTCIQIENISRESFTGLITEETITTLCSEMIKVSNRNEINMKKEWEKQVNQEGSESPKTPTNVDEGEFEKEKTTESPKTLLMICEEEDAMDGMSVTPIHKSTIFSPFGMKKDEMNFDVELNFDFEITVLDHFKNYLKQLNSKIKSNKLIYEKNNNNII
jgi:hypothetical protein